jgi:hypothetical protein
MLAITSSSGWERHFRHNAVSPSRIPWESSQRLSGAERAAISRSVQAFQLGESGQGSFLLRAAARRAEGRGDFDYLASLELFVKEEQHHARDLGRFMRRERIEFIHSHWTNTVFRALRKLMGLELCIITLLTAEVIAISYYRALGRATNAAVLKALCRKILSDESAHIRFQATMLTQLQQDRPRWLTGCELQLQRALLWVTAVVVWTGHRACLRAGGYSLRRFGNETQRKLGRLLAEPRAKAAGLSPPRLPTDT